MAAPHWSRLPDAQGPIDDDDDYPQLYHRSLAAQPPRPSNRASVQTANTDAFTESTFSPHSPTESSFLESYGLAPRPPSYQRGFTQGPVLDGSERFSRRPDRYSSHDYDNDLVAAPPAAPDVPQEPPISYRAPPANGRSPYIKAAPQFAEHHQQQLPAPGGDAFDADMEPEAYYTTRRGEHPEFSGRQVHHVAGRRVGSGEPVPLNVAAAQQRRASANEPAERRKKFANDRSPLQRLELTLDSMTKEEKRARVQAAEQRARQRAAMRAAAEAELKQPIEQRERQISIESPKQPSHPVAFFAPPPVEKEQQPPPLKVNRQATSYAQQRAEPRYPPKPMHGESTDPPMPVAQPQTAVREDAIDSGIPKRNLSFRERASRNDSNLPDKEAGPTGASQASGGGLSLTRSGSNKLRKEPPGDPWYYQRMEAEKGDHLAPKKVRANVSDQPRPRNLSEAITDKELPPVPKQENAVPSQGIQRRATEPVYGREYGSDEEYIPADHRRNKVSIAAEAHKPTPEGVAAARRRLERQDSDSSSETEPHHGMSNMIYKDPDMLKPGDGLYKSPVWMDEWKKATVGSLGAGLLELGEDSSPTADKSKAWWEGGSGRRRSSGYTSKPRKAEAFDGEYADTNGPTRFKPPLYLKCGPLLRYCGIRQEKIPSSRSSSVSEREIWRGSVMIVTRDSDSSYDIAPMLRLFVQDIPLLPAPPHQVDGDLPQEFVDPIAGHPKLGRRGETLFVRPVEHLEEAKDVSLDETDEGLFERSRSPPDVPPANGAAEAPGSFAGRQKRIQIDGEKLQKYKDVRGFRLHTESGSTFWRFNIEVELREKQQRIAYRINRGPCMAFWVPARGETMNIMFHSCNGFSASVKPDDLSGPDPMWRDVLNTHQSKPFHVMVGGGDQIYNDRVSEDCAYFDEWLDIKTPLQKHKAPFTADMQQEMEEFYLNRYCMWFSRGLFGLANSQIPMVNMYDDHDIFDGYGSYPHHYMKSPVFTGLGAVAFKYYMLFQHQSILPETENVEPSWILGAEPGPYIKELSRSVYVSMGGKVALLAVDCRTERTEHDVINDKTWEKIMNRLYAEVRRGQVEHLLVVLGVPVAYPRLVWLENILTSRLMDPVKALGRAGVFGKALNNIDGGVEVLDDLNDHWTAKNHKHERSVIVEDLQDLAIDKSLRVTILSGDVHLAAVGQFYSNPKLGLAKHKDPRYMVNVVSSAIVNTPPSDFLADVLNKRNKVHHFDKQTDENMVPLFKHGVDGKSRNNKHLLPHRNWCSISLWTPGRTPPPTPPMSDSDGSPSPPPAPAEHGGSGGGGLFRRLSLGGRTQSNRFDASRPSVRDTRPPVSGGGGLFRGLSLSRRNSSDAPRPGKLTRTLSLGSGESARRGFFSFGRRNSKSRPDDGGINGEWGYDSAEDDDEDYEDERVDVPRPPSKLARSLGLRGGGLNDEFSDDDDMHFTAQPPRRAQTIGSQPQKTVRVDEGPDPMRRPFHRTPTGLSTKQRRKADMYEVNLEGGLDICLNVEVNCKDPTGITVPYRLLVPRLHYEYDPADDELKNPVRRSQPSGFKRLLSLRMKEKPNPPPQRDMSDNEDDSEDDHDNDSFESNGTTEVHRRR